MKKIALIVLIAAMAILPIACETSKNSDDTQRQQQENLLQEATNQTGMPAIKNFRERKLLKDILELRDQEGLVTYTYIEAEISGKLVFIGQSVGYGIPYATQYTSPEKPGSSNGYYREFALPQADPNGLFSPASAEGTWVLLLDPNGSGAVKPIYVEPRVIVSPFKLPKYMLVDPPPNY